MSRCPLRLTLIHQVDDYKVLNFRGFGEVGNVHKGEEKQAGMEIRFSTTTYFKMSGKKQQS